MGCRRFHGAPESLGLLAITAAASLLAVLDFGLFEVTESLSWVTAVVHSKPGGFSLSFFSTQLMVFGIIAAVGYTVLELGRRLAATLGWRRNRIPSISLTFAAVAAATLVLRLWKYPDPLQRAFILALSSLLVGLWCYSIDSRRFSSSRNPVLRFLSSWQTQLCFLFLAHATAILVPELSQHLATAKQRTHQAATSPNIFFIVLDTVRADHLGHSGNSQVSTPTLDRLASEGICFRNAYATAPWTVPSHASMFTGLLPSSHGAAWGHEFLSEEKETIAEHLVRCGYQTAAFSENPFIGFSHGFAQGFQEFFESWKSPMILRVIDELAVRSGIRYNSREYAPKTLSLVHRWLARNENHDRPFFIFVNLMAAHLPRYPRPKFGPPRWDRDTLRRIEPTNRLPERFYIPSQRLGHEDLMVMKAIYDEQIEYLDNEIGLFIRTLHENGMLTNTLFIITSDHGENFGDHGFIEHQLCLYNSLIHVPLLIWDSDFQYSTNIENAVSTSAIPAVISEIAHSFSSSGGSQEPIARRERILKSSGQASLQPLFAEYSNGIFMLKGAIGDSVEGVNYDMFDRDIVSVIYGKFKYIHSTNGSRELYDLSADFMESENLFSNRPEVAAELERLVLRLSALDRSPGLVQRPIVDPSTIDALTALGYEVR